MAHILLVDDNQDLCEMLTCLLRSEGHEVTTAPDGQVAIKEFHKRVPDLILLDLMMPKIDGMEVCWRLRAFSKVPIIIISAKEREMARFRCMEAGADAFITKPIQIEVLLNKIKTVLANHSNYQNQCLNLTNTLQGSSIETVKNPCIYSSKSPSTSKEREEVNSGSSGWRP